MIKNVQTAVKFFVYGLLAGLIFAPRSGEQTRKELLTWVTSTVKETASTVTGQTGGSGGNA